MNTKTRSNAEILAFSARAKSLARSKGHACIAEDFAQEALIDFISSEYVSLEFVLIDFLRKTYGDKRSGTFALKNAEVRGRNSLDTPIAEGVELPQIAAPAAAVSGESQAWRLRLKLTLREELIIGLMLDCELNVVEIGETLGVSGSRISQQLGRIKAEIAKAKSFDDFIDTYKDDPEASKLQVDWIRL